MKYAIVIVNAASGWPWTGRGHVDKICCNKSEEGFNLVTQESLFRCFWRRCQTRGGRILGGAQAAGRKWGICEYEPMRVAETGVRSATRDDKRREFLIAAMPSL
jgi:hypothetical protein